MAVFAYQGRNAPGDKVSGTLEGAESGEIADQLFKLGISPVAISHARNVAKAAYKVGVFERFLREKKIEPLELMLFSRQMHTLLKAGVPIMRALAGLQESSQNPAFGVVLQDMRESLDSGRELSAAMRRHPGCFPRSMSAWCRSAR